MYDLADLRGFPVRGVLVWGLLWAIGIPAAAPCADQGDRVAVDWEKRTLSSPNYPHNYPENADCVWRITAEYEDHVVQIVTDDMRIEQQLGEQGCSYDFVQVFDGYGTESPMLGRWCGTKKPTIVSTGRSITVRFYSDSTYTTSGFRISYEAGPPDSFSTKEKPRSGMSAMAMVGYMVLVLSLLTIGIIFLRLALSRYKWCQHRQRSIFRRAPNMAITRRDQSSNPGSDVSTIPVPPPLYEESDYLDNAPPPYSELPEPVAVNAQSGPAEGQVNSSFVGDHSVVDLPPSYSSVMLQSLSSPSTPDTSHVEGCENESLGNSAANVSTNTDSIVRTEAR